MIHILKAIACTNIRHYTDDGFSGGSFERPVWKKMIEDIENGLISTVTAKDMSRIGNTKFLRQKETRLTITR